MQHKRREFVRAAALAAVAGPALAQQAKAPAEGFEYKAIKPTQPTDAPAGKVEVVEFFWYGCPHCFDFEPILHKWIKKLPADVSFRRVPAIFGNQAWTPAAKLYYALESMNLIDKMHGEVFDAMHVDRINLQNEKYLFDWVEKKGIDRQKFTEAYNSFAVTSKAQRAMQLTQAHKLQGVPALVVQGKYMPASGAAGSYDDVIVIVDKLIAKARTELPKK